MATQLVPAGLSASVTRILALSGFPSELKTRDIQAAFSDWENINGGFKIKWRDDTSLLIVFADANTAKRAYLQAIAQPPPLLGSPTSSKTALIRPYDGQDAQQVIAAVNARTHGHTASRHHGRASISGGVAGILAGGNGNGNGGNGRKGSVNGGGALSGGTPISTGPARGVSPPLIFPRDHSPTLPNVPAHPTLSSLINLSLSPNGEGAAAEGFGEGDVIIPPSTSAAIPIVAPEERTATTSHANTTPPRIGDPGRRMVGHALGIKLPGLGQQQRTEGDGAAVAGIQRTMGGLSLSEGS